MDAAQFIGMSKKGAQDAVEAKNMIFRLIRINAQSFYDYPDEPRTDRVCIEIDNGKVTKAVIQ
jgi:hypothetical protein